MLFEYVTEIKKNKKKQKARQRKKELRARKRERKFPIRMCVIQCGDSVTAKQRTTSRHHKAYEKYQQKKLHAYLAFSIQCSVRVWIENWKAS